MRNCVQAIKVHRVGVVSFIIAVIVVSVHAAARADDVDCVKDFGPLYDTAANCGRKKIIYLGWDVPTVSYMRLHQQRIDTLAIDGCMFRVSRQDAAGGKIDSLDMWRHNQPRWTRDELQAAADDLRACTFSHVTENFLRICVVPGDVDWFDDTQCETLVNNISMLAWVAREGNARGICLDPEQYRKHLWSYEPSSGHSFLETAHIVRRRGRQLGSALRDVWLDMTIFTLLGYSTAGDMAEYADPLSDTMPYTSYALYVHFLHGLLEAMGPEMTVVDGYEHGYRINSTQGFLHSYYYCRSRLEAVIPHELRNIYRTQYQVGMAVFMDAHIGSSPRPFHIDTRGQTVDERLRRNMTSAIAVSDTYIWIYGATHYFFPDSYARDQKRIRQRIDGPWSDDIPDIDRAIRWAKDPHGMARRELPRLIRESALVDLTPNGSFNAPDSQTEKEAEKEHAAADWEDLDIPGWYTWQAASSSGQFSHVPHKGFDGGYVDMKGVTGGCYVTMIDTTPGRQYIIEGRIRAANGTKAMIRGAWYPQNGSRPPQTTYVYAHAGEDVKATRGWKHATAICTAPLRATQMRLTLISMAEDQASARAAFDEVHVWEVGQILGGETNSGQ